jgi:hypothetical protein
MSGAGALASDPPRLWQDQPAEFCALGQALIALSWSRWRDEYADALRLTLVFTTREDVPAGGAREPRDGGGSAGAGERERLTVDVRSICVRDSSEAEAMRAQARLLALMPIRGALPMHAVEHLQLTCTRFTIAQGAADPLVDQMIRDWAADMRVSALDLAVADEWAARAVAAGLSDYLHGAFADLRERVHRGELRNPRVALRVLRPGLRVLRPGLSASIRVPPVVSFTEIPS